MYVDDHFWGKWPHLGQNQRGKVAKISKKSNFHALERDTGHEIDFSKGLECGWQNVEFSSIFDQNWWISGTRDIRRWWFLRKTTKFGSKSKKNYRQNFLEKWPSTYISGTRDPPVVVENWRKSHRIPKNQIPPPLQKKNGRLEGGGILRIFDLRLWRGVFLFSCGVPWAGPEKSGFWRGGYLKTFFQMATFEGGYS